MPPATPLIAHRHWNQGSNRRSSASHLPDVISTVLTTARRAGVDDSYSTGSSKDPYILKSEAQQVYGYLMSFENSLRSLRSKPIYQWSPSDSAPPLFDEALRYQSYNLANAFKGNWTHPALHQISRRFFMMPHNCCRNGYVELLRTQSPVFLVAASRLIRKARSDFNELCRDNPSMEIEFMVCQAALDLYFDKIQKTTAGEIDLGHSTSTAWFPLGARPPPTPPSMSRSSSQSYDLVQDQALGARAGPYSSRFENAEPLYSRPLPAVHHRTPETNAANLVLRGWIYHGQVLTQSFGVYIRVFIMLARAVRS